MYYLYYSVSMFIVYHFFSDMCYKKIVDCSASIYEQVVVTVCVMEKPVTASVSV